MRARIVAQLFYKYLSILFRNYASSTWRLQKLQVRLQFISNSVEAYITLPLIIKFTSIYTPLDSIHLKPDATFCSIDKTLQQFRFHFVRHFLTSWYDSSNCFSHADFGNLEQVGNLTSKTSRSWTTNFMNYKDMKNNRLFLNCSFVYPPTYTCRGSIFNQINMAPGTVKRAIELCLHAKGTQLAENVKLCCMAVRGLIFAAQIITKDVWT